MNLQQIAIWLRHHREFVGVSLLAVTYGATIDVREEREFSVSREDRANASIQRLSSRRNV